MLPPFSVILFDSTFKLGLWSIERLVISFPYLLERIALESPTFAI